MGAVVGDLLPLAIGIAISPVPIIAVILMLLSRKATATSTGFLLGWVAGVVVVTVVVLAVVGQAGDTSGGEPSTVSSVLKLVFGVLLLFMALRQWRSRPKAGDAGEMPTWMGAIESFTFGRALGLGFLSAAATKPMIAARVGVSRQDGSGSGAMSTAVREEPVRNAPSASARRAPRRWPASTTRTRRRCRNAPRPTPMGCRTRSWPRSS